MAWNKSQACRSQPSLTKLSLSQTLPQDSRALLGEKAAPPGHRGRQNPVLRRKLSIRLSAFFDETEGMKKEERPCQAALDLQRARKNVI